MKDRIKKLFGLIKSPDKLFPILTIVLSVVLIIILVTFITHRSTVKNTPREVFEEFIETEQAGLAKNIELLKSHRLPEKFKYCSERMIDQYTEKYIQYTEEFPEYTINDIQYIGSKRARLTYHVFGIKMHADFVKIKKKWYIDKIYTKCSCSNGHTKYGPCVYCNGTGYLEYYDFYPKFDIRPKYW